MYLDLKSYFDRVVIITLRQRQDQFRRLIDEITKMPWPFAQPELFINIHGEKLGVPQGWSHGPGAWGCLCSHREVLQSAFREEVKRILVLEDDCTFAPNFVSKIVRFLEAVPENWEQLMLGGQLCNEYPAMVVSPDIAKISHCTRTHCYALQGSAIRSLWLEWNRVGFNAHCDWVMAEWQEHHRVFAPIPFLAGQISGQSSINGYQQMTRFWSARDPGQSDKFAMPTRETLADQYGSPCHHFIHSGKFGDIIYALPAIRAVGGGVIWMDDCRSLTQMNVTPAVVQNIKPLLLAQPYIKDVRFCTTRQPGFGINLNGFRNRGTGNLWSDVMRMLNLPFQSAATPWISVKKSRRASVIVNRSFRYRNPKFPWKDVVSAHGKEMAFIGMDDEYTDFCVNVGMVPRIFVSDLLEAAEIIAGADLFVGNQSCLLAIAQGMHQHVICEAWPRDCNVRTLNPNATYVFDSGPVTQTANA